MEVGVFDQNLHSQIMKSTLFYSKRAHYAHKELDMAALVYLSDKPVDLDDVSDWRVQLLRDTSKEFKFNQVVPMVWSKWNDEQIQGTNSEIEPLFQILGTRWDEKLPAILFLGTKDTVSRYNGPIGNPDRISAEILSTWTDLMIDQDYLLNLQEIVMKSLSDASSETQALWNRMLDGADKRVKDS